MATPAARVTIEPAKPASGTHVRREANELAVASPATAPLVPATAPLVPPAAPAAPPVIVPPELDDGEDAPDDRGHDDDAAMVSGAGASAPPPPVARTGARLQRSSLPELFKAMISPDKDENGGFLVDDDTEKLTDAQLRKSTFLKELRVEVHRVADEELSTVHLSAVGCPYLDEMLRRYNGRTAAEVERAVRRYAPEARGVKKARDYIPYVVDRLRRGIRRWIETRKIPPDLPREEVDSFLRAGGWIGAIVGLAGKTPPKDDDSEDKDVPAKDKDQQPRRKALGPSSGRVDGGALVRQLGPGAPLDGGTRARMEHALGHSFASVRIHADDRAADLNRDLAARAFTIGSHVALGAGAPAPGTIEGDALLAHELAHVMQQDGAAPVGEIDVGDHDDPLERDADVAAAHALGALHGERAPQPAPRARGALSLRRCGDKPKPVVTPPTPKPKPTVHSQRFDGDDGLQAIESGTATLAPGATSMQVTKVQQALADLRFLDPGKVTGTNDPATVAALSAFQKAKSVPDSAGTVDAPTMAALRAAFDDLGPYVDLAKDPAVAANKLAGTRALTADQKQAVTSTLNPQQKVDASGAPIEPTFVDDLGSGHTFEADVRDFLDKEITAEFNAMAAGKAALRSDPKNLFDWKPLEAVGAEAKREVDAVFGGYKKGGDVLEGTILFDRWDVQEKRINDDKAAGDSADIDGITRWRIQKIINEDEGFAALLDKHGAMTKRSPEKDTIKKVQEDLMKSREADLLELQKAWPGSSDRGKIFLQRFKSADPMDNRIKLWNLFETTIHEYIHTLTDPAYSAFARDLGDPSGHTLREGMTDVLTKIVWNHVQVTDGLRKKIEGPLYDEMKPVDVPALDTYPQTAEAERVMSIVGARNVYAAYFNGEIQLIGGTKPP